MGVSASRYPTPSPAGFGPGDEALVDCILCGLCVRACTEAIGASAIGFAARGPSRRVATPFLANSQACIGCGACAAVCPTGVIRLEDTSDGKRRIPFLHTEVPLKRCERCGSFFAPEPQLDTLRVKAAPVQDLLEVCPACRMRGFAAEMIARQAVRR
jgi:ferredoxin